jgi:hypothetical protein
MADVPVAADPAAAPLANLLKDDVTGEMVSKR